MSSQDRPKSSPSRKPSQTAATKSASRRSPFAAFRNFSFFAVKSVYLENTSKQFDLADPDNTLAYVDRCTAFEDGSSTLMRTKRASESGSQCSWTSPRARSTRRPSRQCSPSSDSSMA